MAINTVELFYFSPTETTKKILEGIAAGIDSPNIYFTDLTKVKSKIVLKRKSTNLVVIGMPTYASRVPPEGAFLMKKLQGDGIPVVLAAVYGNNKFGDVLLEMKNITKSNGFIPIGAAAFIGEHSFSTGKKPIAAGRPDSADIKKAQEFGKAVSEKFIERDANFAYFELEVPGNFPYREWHKIPAEPPSTDNSICVKCGKCKSGCPVNAITIDSSVKTDPDLCIFCCACVKECSEYARRVTDPKLLEITDRLYNNCREPKSPEMFL